MLSCLVGENRINLFDKKYDKIQLKKWADKNILICPACNKPYEYCHGKIKIPYFRHKDKELCLDKYSESETQEHLQGKRDIYEWLLSQDNIKDVVLEGWIPETKQRPDIMFKYNGIQHVIEYQCTPISTEYYERHDLYNAVGIVDIWICGANKYFQSYHKGSGNKRMSVIENESRKYYDPITKNMYMLDKYFNIDKIDYEKYDLFLVKNIGLSYSSYSYYKSRRMGWVTISDYEGNNSLAKYIPLSKIKI